jgi:aryl-alcohol dehydrogenase-like predicted oxidoreductase
MDYVNLGATGLKVSRLCLGCMTYGDKSWRDWILTEEESRPFFKEAVEAGITFFDTADVYSHGASEAVTGRALKEFTRRDEIVLATKVHNPVGDPSLKHGLDRGLSRKHIFAAIDASLKRLGVDYVDLYQIHRFDYDTPIEETMEALHDVVKAGKARYIGASSMYAWQFARMNHAADLNGWTRFVSMQPQYNLLYREEEREMLPLCEEEGIGVIPWSPLARGFLAGTHKRGGGGESTRSNSDPFLDKLFGSDDDFNVVDAVSAVAKAKGVANMQVALAWVLSKPAATAPIIGASKPHHLGDALAALELELSPEEIETLEAPYRCRPIGDHD